MINTGKVFLHIALQDVAVSPCVFDATFESAMGAKSLAVGVAIRNEGALENWNDDVAEGMVDDAIAIGRSRNQPGLRFKDLEGAIFTGAIGLGF